MASAPEPTPSSPPRPTARRAATILLLLAGAALLVNYVETMLVPALPTLVGFYDHASYADVAWVVSIYLLVGVVSTPVFGRLGDIYGKKRMLVAVLGIYATAVAIAGFTPQIATMLGISRANALYLLIAVRGAQGLGLAMFPLSFAMIGEELPPAQVAPAQGLISAMFAVGASAGLFGGSWVIQTYGWQFAYELVIPLAFVIVGFAAYALPESHHRARVSVDAPGAALLGTALGSFLVGLTVGPTWGWTRWNGVHLGGLPLGVPELFGLSLAAAVGFYVRERTAAEPILNLARLAERNRAIAFLTALLVGVTLFLAFVTLTLLVELPIVGLGRSLFDFGVMSLPTTFAMLLAAPLVGRAVARFGPRPVMLLGAGLSSLGFVLLLTLPWWYLGVMLEAIPLFVGLVALLVSALNIVVLSARRDETGVHTGLTEMFQDLGASIGPVAVSLFATTYTATHVVPVVGTAGPTTATVVLPDVAAFHGIFALGLGFVLAAGVLASFVRNYHFATETPAPSSEGVSAAASASP